jgi:DNA-binding response OmpR family regulator
MRQAGLVVVERDASFGAELAGYLEGQGYPTLLVPDLAALLRLLELGQPALVLLGEQEAGVLPALGRLRDASRLPCIVLAAEPDRTIEILALEAGADDYLAASLPPRAILARIRSLLRRCAPAAEPAQAPCARGWQFHPTQRRLLRPDGSECELTTAEFDLLRLLIQAEGLPVSRDDIAATVFRRRLHPEDRSVDNLVLRLRRKLGPAQARAIKTVRGAGYMFAGFMYAPPRLA